MSINYTRSSILYVILFVLVVVPIFGFLERLPIQKWDEARVALNAYEMYKSGDLIVPTICGAPEMWNTKPPFLLWTQALCMHLIGPNVLAIRLPSALASLFTSLILFIFLLRYLRDHWLALLSVLVLVTTNGYIHTHVARTGDYEAMLILWTTLSNLLFYVYCKNKKTKFLYAFFISMAIAVLTKSIAGVLFVPGLLIYALYSRNLKSMLTSRHLYFGAGAFVIIVLSYYFMREFYNPGYLAAVYQNELGGRYLTTIEQHAHPFWYYYHRSVDTIGYWRYFLAVGIIVGLLHPDRRIKSLSLYCITLSSSFFLVISFAQTKLQWYDAPIYPLLAILAAIPIYSSIQVLLYQIRKYDIFPSILSVVLPIIISVLACHLPYKAIVIKNYQAQEIVYNQADSQVTEYLHTILMRNQVLPANKICHGGYNCHLLIYRDLLREKGVNLTMPSPKNLIPGDRVLVIEEEVHKYIQKHYESDIVMQKDLIAIYHINAEK